MLFLRSHSPRQGLDFHPLFCVYSSSANTQGFVCLHLWLVALARNSRIDFGSNMVRKTPRCIHASTSAHGVLITTGMCHMCHCAVGMPQRRRICWFHFKPGRAQLAQPHMLPSCTSFPANSSNGLNSTSPSTTAPNASTPPSTCQQPRERQTCC